MPALARSSASENVSEQKDYLKRFIDQAGKVVNLPRRPSQRKIVLEYLSGKFEAGKIFTEKEVNQVLIQNHLFGDPALLRRELFDGNYLDRTEDGGRYWRKKGPDS